jgi:hypothetical protein
VSKLCRHTQGIGIKVLIFLAWKIFQTISEARPFFYSVCRVGLFLGVREQGLEPDHLKPVLKLEGLRKIKKNRVSV